MARGVEGATRRFGLGRRPLAHQHVAVEERGAKIRHLVPLSAKAYHYPRGGGCSNVGDPKVHSRVRQWFVQQSFRYAQSEPQLSQAHAAVILGSQGFPRREPRARGLAALHAGDLRELVRPGTRDSRRPSYVRAGAGGGPVASEALFRRLPIWLGPPILTPRYAP
jgi:hypothetical protein